MGAYSEKCDIIGIKSYNIAYIIQSRENSKSTSSVVRGVMSFIRRVGLFPLPPPSPPLGNFRISLRIRPMIK
jgi:hypothetical protein